MHKWIIGAVIAATLSAPAQAADELDLTNSTDVMIVGVFHLANPNHDLHDFNAPDVLAPKYQAELETIARHLDRFHPTMVDVERAPGTVEKKYASYLAGTLKPSRDEVVQLGFRLARMAGLKSVQGIDQMADFPYEPVQAYAKAHGQSYILDYGNDQVAAEIRHGNDLLRREGIRATLRLLNDPPTLAKFNAFYPLMLRVGGGDDQPGAELLKAWYGRNFRICANLVQHAKPGGRIVVVYGAGHALLLRQCIAQSPGFRLVEPNDYL
ncbi:MAG: hypothetical protein KGJ78_13620 [Alphaproteobacteria bacterium]|nr:hypothetical protein [Alphaproteobacteria bacterium]